jgi:arylamine N-acetyltransferase
MMHVDEVRRRYPKFADRVRYGAEMPDAIHDYIDAWHDGDSKERLHEFLGLTMEQFIDWVGRGDEALAAALPPRLTPEEEAEVQRLYGEMIGDLKNGLDILREA